MCVVPELFLQFDVNLHPFLYSDYEYFAWFAGINNTQGQQARFEAVFRWKGLHRAYDPQAAWNDWNNGAIQYYPLVTRVFLQHLREPQKYPLFDINVWKAARRMDEHIRNNAPENYRDGDYQEYYVPFFNERYEQVQQNIVCPQIDGVDEEIVKRRVLDRALWEFGRMPEPNG